MSETSQYRPQLLFFNLVAVASIGIIFLFLAEFYSTPFYSVVALILYLWVIAVMYNSCAYLLIATLPILVLKLTEVTSFVTIEYGGYMHESMKFGTASAGSLRYFLVTLVFLAGTFVAFGHSGRVGHIIPRPKGVPQVHSLTVRLTLVSILLVDLNALLVGVTHGFPFLIGAERFGYWQNVSNPFVRVFLNYHAAISFLLASLYMMDVKAILSVHPKRVSLYFLCAHFVLMLLFGFKQTAFSLSLSFALMPILFDATVKGRKPKLISFSVWIGAILSLSVVVAFLSYSGSSLSEKVTRLVDRIALQGQLWHLADLKRMADQSNGFISIYPEVSEWFSARFRPATEVGFEFGLYNVMQHFATYDTLYYYTRDGIGFIFALLPAWLLSYGYSTMTVLVFGTGLMWGLTMRLAFAAWRFKSYFSLLFLSVVLMMHTSAYVDGMSYRIFGLKVWIYLSAAAVALFFTATNNEHGQR